MMPGISALVNSLKGNHPNYDFQYYNTSLDWNTSILREYQGHGYSPYNLFNFGAKYSGMWYCPVCGTKIYDNGSLSCASKEAISYMMDPRNSLTEESVFQFKNLELADSSYDEIANACIGTFLNNGECVQAILEASQAYNINAFYLVSKILTEQGTNGSTLSRGVVVNGVTYYNLFNIGAYGNSTEIITNGANYAAGQGWDSMRASILGGALTVKNNYVGKGQNTCYYQKFNVVNTQSGLYKHQYAQNILSAENEGRKFKACYTLNNTINGNHTFIIPVYINMPSTACIRPSTATPNTIIYETGVITANSGVKVRAGEGTNMEQIGSIPKESSVKIIARGFQEVSGYYWDLVISDTDGVYGYVARNYIATTGNGSNGGDVSGEEYSTPQVPSQSTPTNVNRLENKHAIKNSLFIVSAGTTIQDIQSVYGDAVVIDTNGAISIDVCTGYTLITNGVTYYIAKRGDVNGDGQVDISDIVIMLNHIKQINIITDAATFEASCISNTAEVTVVDVVKALNYVKGEILDIFVNGG